MLVLYLWHVELITFVWNFSKMLKLLWLFEVQNKEWSNFVVSSFLQYSFCRAIVSNLWTNVTKTNPRSPFEWHYGTMVCCHFCIFRSWCWWWGARGFFNIHFSVTVASFHHFPIVCRYLFVCTFWYLYYLLVSRILRRHICMC